ncbi:MAG TPA: hypothetical protein VHL57_04090, partial [Flavobacteriales bacterium]|jgi:hypothetical protein|nr:hypothetical protein [Flavobacteriales bacterium]
VRILRDRKGPNGEDIGMGDPAAINQLIAHHAVVFQPEKRLLWVSTWPYQMGAFVCYDLNKVFARCRAGNVSGPMYEADRTIAADPFVGSPAMQQHEAHSATRNAIYDHLISGAPLHLSTAEEEAFIREEPTCYLTYVTLGDLRKAQGREASAIAFYQRALRAPAVPPAERDRIQRSIAACAPR